MTNIISMKKFEMLGESSKCHTETWANAVGKMASIDVLNTELSQILNLFKNEKKHYLQRAIRQSTIKWDLPVVHSDICFLLPLLPSGFSCLGVSIVGAKKGGLPQGSSDLTCEFKWVAPKMAEEALCLRSVDKRSFCTPAFMSSQFTSVFQEGLLLLRLCI